MSHRFVVAALAATLVLTVASPAGAFNGHRKGFMLGAGFGPGYSSYKQELVIPFVGTATASESNAGFATEFRIGGGVTDQFFLYYSNKVNWFSMDNSLNSSVTVTDGLSALAGQYFFRPQAPSGFLTGGIGIASWATPLEEGSSSLSGGGLFVGGGWEFSRLLSLEGSLGYGEPKKTEGGVKLTTKSTAVRILVHFTGY